MYNVYNLDYLVDKVVICVTMVTGQLPDIFPYIRVLNWTFHTREKYLRNLAADHPDHSPLLMWLNRIEFVAIFMIFAYDWFY